MEFLIDQKLVDKLVSDSDFQKIKGALSYPDNRIFRCAWVMYQAKDSLRPLKWHPVLIKDQDSGKVGFEYNPGGWKSKNKAGKVKLSLQELLSIIVNRSFNSNDTVRCKYSDSSSQDGRNISDMQFDEDLSSLLAKYKYPTLPSSESSHATELSDAPIFSENEKSIVAQSANEIEEFIDGFNGEEKDVIAKYRLNQGKYRNVQLRYWDNTCAVSGLKDSRLLVASHILPWSKSTASQKGNPYNGLLLSVVWDSLFDKGLISFDDDGKAILDRLSAETIRCLGLECSNQAISTDKLTTQHRQYLQMHRVLHDFY